MVLARACPATLRLQRLNRSRAVDNRRRVESTTCVSNQLTDRLLAMACLGHAPASRPHRRLTVYNIVQVHGKGEGGRIEERRFPDHQLGGLAI